MYFAFEPRGFLGFGREAVALDTEHVWRLEAAGVTDSTWRCRCRDIADAWAFVGP